MKSDKQEQMWEVVDDKGEVLATTHHKITALRLSVNLKLNKSEKLFVRKIENAENE